MTLLNTTLAKPVYLITSTPPEGHYYQGKQHSSLLTQHADAVERAVQHAITQNEPLIVYPQSPRLSQKMGSGDDRQNAIMTMLKSWSI